MATSDHAITNRARGWANRAKGTVKEALGEITGDAALHAEGKLDRLKAKAQCAPGSTTDPARDE